MSSKTKKLIICPYFGDLPPWYDLYSAQFEKLKSYGYDFLIDTDLEGFKKRVKEKLDIDAPITYGVPKIFDYRCALGLLYEKELEGYEWWGTADFDVVFGDLDKWITDELLANLDLFSNHVTYVCGFFSLYRNTPDVNNLFLKFEFWKDMLLEERVLGWVETSFSNLLEASGLRYAYRGWQGDYTDTEPKLKLEGEKLYQNGEEIMCFHFRRSKKWPL